VFGVGGCAPALFLTLKLNFMKFCVIPPLANLNLMNQGQMIFALAQLYLRHEEYREFIHQKKAEGWFIIMDNGTGDHDLVSTDELIQVCKEVMPNEIIAPDILFDKDRTIDGCKEFVDRMIAEDLIGLVDIFFCPQGNNIDEWLECYQFALDNDYIGTIGLSKLSVPHCWLPEGYNQDQNVMQGRHKCVDYLVEHDLLKKPMHCLGAGNPIEFQRYLKVPLIRSTDSCFSVLAAIHNYRWACSQMTRVPTPKDYFTNYILDDKQIEVLRENLEILALMCTQQQIQQDAIA
jgi:hypothetical protein